MGKMKKKQLAEELNTEMTAVVALEIEKRQEPVGNRKASGACSVRRVGKRTGPLHHATEGDDECAEQDPQ